MRRLQLEHARQNAADPFLESREGPLVGRDGIFAFATIRKAWQLTRVDVEDLAVRRRKELARSQQHCLDARHFIVIGGDRIKLASSEKPAQRPSFELWPRFLRPTVFQDHTVSSDAPLVQEPVDTATQRRLACAEHNDHALCMLGRAVEEQSIGTQRRTSGDVHVVARCQRTRQRDPEPTRRSMRSVGRIQQGLVKVKHDELLWRRCRVARCERNAARGVILFKRAVLGDASPQRTGRGCSSRFASACTSHFQYAHLEPGCARQTNRFSIHAGGRQRPAKHDVQLSTAVRGRLGGAHEGGR
mmetsp:Transcript_12179/g.31009  ORF Transcript_12179/g.31009 Transcript_12179/m.31009 type:complete len:301 (-) Transcript_12179:403-1305(-)